MLLHVNTFMTLHPVPLAQTRRPFEPYRPLDKVIERLASLLDSSMGCRPQSSLQEQLRLVLVTNDMHVNILTSPNH